MNAPEHLIAVGDVRKLLPLIPSGSVHCVVTSPPYWGLRDYGTATWEGGDPDCEHSPVSAPRSSRPSGGLTGGKATVEAATIVKDACPRCGATRIDDQIGLEPTPEEYVAAMVTVFREVRRILRDDGTAWLNLGDSYAGSWGNQGRKEERGTQRPINGPMMQNLAPYPVKQSNTGKIPEGSGLKPKDLCLIPERVALALQADGWWVRAKPPWIKCLSGGARVYARTQKGEMPTTIKDVARLDPKTVELWNGTRWTRVVAWEKSSRNGDEIEIEFRSGERVGCTPNHRWPTARGLVEASNLVIGDVVDSCRLPEPERPRRPEHLPDGDIGWLVGFYIAEGHPSEKGPIFSINKYEIYYFDKIKETVGRYDATARMHNIKGGDGAVVVVNGPSIQGIIDTYVSGSTCHDKHLTMRTWKRSDGFLGAVLDGYLAGDGHHDSGNRRWRLGFTRNTRWADDIRTLAARLGITARIRPRIARNTATGISYPAFKGEIRFERSGTAGGGRFEAKPDGQIVAIRRSRARWFYDVSVTDDPHLFTLASGLMTHNSNPMPESVTDRPTTAHESIFLLTKSERYFYDSDAVRMAMAERSAERYTYAFGGAKSEALADADRGGIGVRTRPVGFREPTAGRNRRSSEWFNESLDDAIDHYRAYLAHLERVRDRGGVLLDDEAEGLPLAFRVATEPWRGAHFAVFPRRLVEPMIRMGTSEGGCCPACGAPWRRDVVAIGREVSGNPRGARAVLCEGRAVNGAVLFRQVRVQRGWKPGCDCHDPPLAPVPCTVMDPFSGAGTTGSVADNLGRRFVGLELNPDYAGMGARRIARPHAPVERPPAPTRGQQTFF